MGQLGFFDADKRLEALSAKGDPLEAIDRLVPWESLEMKGSRTRLRKVLPEREREEAAVPEAIERLISRGPPRPVRGLAQLASLWLHCLSGLEASAYLFRPLLQDGR